MKVASGRPVQAEEGVALVLAFRRCSRLALIGARSRRIRSTTAIFAANDIRAFSFRASDLRVRTVASVKCDGSFMGYGLR